MYLIEGIFSCQRRPTTPQGKHADTVITVTDSAEAVRDKNADCFSCRNIYEHKEYFAHVLFMFETEHGLLSC